MVLGYCRGNLAYSSYCGKYSEWVPQSVCVGLESKERSMLSEG